jgi:hypothetical protein
MRSVSVLAQLRMHLVQQQPSGFMTSPSCSSGSSTEFDSASDTSCASTGVVSGSSTAASAVSEVLGAMSAFAFVIADLAGAIFLNGGRLGVDATVAVAGAAADKDTTGFGAADAVADLGDLSFHDMGTECGAAGRFIGFKAVILLSATVYIPTGCPSVRRTADALEYTPAYKSARSAAPAAVCEVDTTVCTGGTDE